MNHYMQSYVQTQHMVNQLITAIKADAATDNWMVNEHELEEIDMQLADRAERKNMNVECAKNALSTRSTKLKSRLS